MCYLLLASMGSGSDTCCHRFFPPSNASFFSVSNIFPLFFGFINLIMLCLGMNFFGFVLCGSHSATGIFRLIQLIKFGEFSAIISSSIFFSLSFLTCGTLVTQILAILFLFHRCLRLCSFFFSVCVSSYSDCINSIGMFSSLLITSSVIPAVADPIH